MALPPDYLIGFDFDGTLADTFAKSPRGFGVNEASAKAVAEVFGEEGKRAYAVIGGLKNRAPSELIEAMLLHGNRVAMTESAKQYARHHTQELEGNMPEGKGVPLTPLLGDGEVPAIVLAEAFVRRKLSILTGEISAEWPKPMPGLLDALSAIRALSHDGTPVRLAVLSSGHEQFIRKCFEVWGVPQPDILITDDDLRGVKHLSAEAKVKPNVYLLARLHQAWRRARGLGPESIDVTQEGEMLRKGMLYTGDDMSRDGKLVMQSEVFFGWYKPTEQEIDPGNNPRLFHFRHWDELTEFLTTPGLGERLKEGESIGMLLAETRLGLVDGRLPERKRPV